MADTLEAAAEPNSFTESMLRVYTEEDCSAFECNICLELAKEPVVTFCGHLYCWPCLYRWMQVNRQCQRCPVCNSGIDVETVVPIYGRGTEGTDPSIEATDDDSAPARPTGRRAIPVARTPLEINQDNVNSVNANQSVVRMLFGFIQGSNMALPDMPAAEQQQQAFLSRLLLMLGSFVIMCLLLF